jgi:DNA-binding XRE family transcriptional regulator
MNIKSKSPNSYEIISSRKEAGITQKDAAQYIYCSQITWQQWEAGKRKMHPAFWELFTLKAGKCIK